MILYDDEKISYYAKFKYIHVKGYLVVYLPNIILYAIRVNSYVQSCSTLELNSDIGNPW